MLDRWERRLMFDLLSWLNSSVNSLILFLFVCLFQMECVDLRGSCLQQTHTFSEGGWWSGVSSAGKKKPTFIYETEIKVVNWCGAVWSVIWFQRLLEISTDWIISKVHLYVCLSVSGPHHSVWRLCGLTLGQDSGLRQTQWCHLLCQVCIVNVDNTQRVRVWHGVNVKKKVVWTSCLGSVVGKGGFVNYGN